VRRIKGYGISDDRKASEYFAVDAAKITPIPDDMSYNEGAMMEPLAVTVHAVKRAGNVKGLKIAVLGAGPIGILLAQSAKAMGAAEVLITDISDYRLELAKKCGADYIVNTKNMDPVILKREYGKDLVFFGGIDENEILAHGTEQKVRDETRRIIDILGSDGRYIVAASHDYLLPEIPTGNIIAMYEEAKKYSMANSFIG
jgi:threonine dehydrogenase-like Zn-dependent dehydrogenase